MGLIGENAGHGIKKHGLTATALTAATILGLVFLYRFLKANLDADLMQKLPRSFRPHSPAQE